MSKFSEQFPEPRPTREVAQQQEPAVPEDKEPRPGVGWSEQATKQGGELVSQIVKLQQKLEVEADLAKQREIITQIETMILQLEHLEQEEKAPHFDPERDISKEDWEKIKEDLEKMRENKDWRNFSELAKNAVILFPERKKELHLDEEVWKTLKELWEENPEELNWFYFSSKAITIRSLFPERIDELNLGEGVWEKMKEGLEVWRTNKNWLRFFSQAVGMMFFSPEKTEELNLNEEAWKAEREMLEYYQDKNLSKDFGYIYSHLENIKQAIILFPEKVRELGLLNEDIWNEIKGVMEDRRPSDPEGFKNSDIFTRWAVAMKILAAEEVKVTDKGLEITMRKPKEKK